MSNNLSKKQLAAITQVAHKAWRQLVTSGAESGDWRDEQDWRHSVQEQHLGPGNTSLKTATQRDYVPIYNHFARIAGIKPISDKTRSEKDKKIWILQDTMRRHEIKTYDLAEIARDKFPAILCMVHQDLMMDAIRAKLDDAQIMQLVYTINNYGRAKTRKLDETLGIDGAYDHYEPHVDKSTQPPGRLSDHFGTTDI